MIRGIVAIVGRPNVGKSTLFNNLTKSHTAITDDRPGVTRDRIYGTAFYDSSREEGFTVVDTGGFESKDYRFQPFADDVVWQQSMAAIRHSHLVVLLVDGRQGLHPHDETIYRELQREGKPFFLVVNKIDGVEHEEKAWDFLKLRGGGIPAQATGGKESADSAAEDGEIDIHDGAPVLLGAKAGYNLRGLVERIRLAMAALNAPKAQGQDQDPTRVALIGKPNVGKSSLLNRLTGEHRALVSDLPGTTRDSITSRLTYHGHVFEVIDTAGLRRKSKVSEQLETYSTIRSISNLQQADLCVLVISAQEGFTEQDARILALAIKKSIPALIVVNKWDLVENKQTGTAKEFATNIYDQIGDMAYVPIVFVSCVANQRVGRVLEYCLRLSQSYAQRVPTAKVNEALERIVSEHTPQVVKRYNKRIKFYYATQIAVKPPTFVVKTNVPKELADSYIRFMTKRFKTYLGFDEIPIVIKFRAKGDAKKKPPSQALAGPAGERGAGLELHDAH